MDELVKWLTAQLDADEPAARHAYGSNWDTDHGDEAGIEWVITEDMHLCEGDAASMQHIARHDPAAVLADIASKRGIIASCTAVLAELNDERRSDRDYYGAGDLADKTLRLLALRYAGRDGYREEWRP